MTARTLYDKLWSSHVVREYDNGLALVYIDRHLIHEVTSPQAFEGLRLAGRKPWRRAANLAVSDHNVPTVHRERIEDPISRLQLETLDANCAVNEITQFKIHDLRQGIVHVIGPEQGFSLPGTTVVCGDSHTSTHGALAALAFGIGTSEVEHVLATQCLQLTKSRNMLVRVNGRLAPSVTAKDLVLYIIGRIGTAGGTGYTIEFAGEAVQALSMEGRMTVCNMAIEAGARSGLIAVDDKTIDYVANRPFAPRGQLFRAGGGGLEGPAFRSRVVVRSGGRDRGRGDQAPGLLGDLAGDGGRGRCAGPGAGGRCREARRDASAPWPTWIWKRGRPSRRSGSIRSSSAPAPTRVSRICARRPRWHAAVTSPRISSRRWSCRARGSSSRRPSARVSTGCSSRPVSNGASRGVPCVSA